MDKIIAAADSLKMVVVVGIFYARAKPLNSVNAYTAAVRLVTSHLAETGRRNTIINIANEQNIFANAPAPASSLANPATIIRLCAVVHSTVSTQVCGGGGFNSANNVAIGKATSIDVLMYDNGGCGANSLSGARFRGFRAAGVTKPIMNVELLPASAGKTSIPGCWAGVALPSGSCGKATYLRHVDDAASTPGLSVFLHTQSWFQNKPPIYRIGGSGTCPNGDTSNAGIRWYLEYVRSKQGSLKV